MDNRNEARHQSWKRDDFEGAPVRVKCGVVNREPRKGRNTRGQVGFVHCARAAVLVGLLGAAQTAHSQPEEDAIIERPPIAQEVRATVERGKSVTIRLKAHGKPGQKIVFIIRRPPEHGVLEPAKGGIGLETFNIIYRHLGDGAVDSFEYATKSAGSPVSVAARVTIRITEPRPILEVKPSLLDFGTLFIGETASRQFEVRNAGGGVLKGSIVVSPRLKLEGAPDYELGPGQSRIWSVTFAPQRQGSLREEILVQRNAYGRLTAIGESRPLFVLAPESLDLKASGTDGTRTGTLQVRNVTDKTLKVTARGPKGWPVQLTDELALAGGETGEISLSLSGSHVQRVAAEISVQAGAQTLKVPVVAPPAPARIEFLDSDRVRLVAGHGSSKTEFRVINRGGEPCAVAWAADSPTTPKAMSGRFELQPGQMARVPVTIDRRVRGETRVRFESGGQTLTGFVSVADDERQAAFASSTPPKRGDSQFPQTQDSGIANSDAPQAEVPASSILMLTHEEAKQLGVVWQAFYGNEEKGAAGPRELRLERASQTAAVLSWLPPPTEDARDYRLELRVLRSGTGDKILEAEWRPLQNVEIAKKEDGRIYGELKGLQRLQTHTVRVRAKVDPERWTRPSNLLEFFTAPSERERFWADVAGWTLAIGLALVVIGGVVWIWRRSRSQFLGPSPRPSL